MTRTLIRPNAWVLAFVVATTVTAGCASLPGVYKAPRVTASLAPAGEPADGDSVPTTPAGLTAVPGGTAAAPLAATAPTATAPPVAQVGLPAPDLELMSLDGAPARLSQYKGKFLALVFFAHW